LPAAMFMAVSKALAKSCALRSNASAAAIMTAVDREIARENPEQNFVTAVALILDLRSGELEYCNAGHEPPLLSRRAGDTVALSHAGGPPLCVIEDYEFEQARVRLGPGDILTLSSDGLTEAMNREGALYGRARLKALLDSPARQAANPAALGNYILAAINEYEGGAEPADDQTLVLLSWGGPT
jgi:adenylate cyclase